MNGFRVGWFEHFRRLWGIGHVSSCPVSGPGLIRAAEYSLLECRDLVEEAVARLCSGLCG